MPIPSSGPLSLTDIQTEFGGTNPISLNEYYAGGGLVPAGTSGTYGAVPSSGQISIQNFYGTSNIYSINNSLRFRASASAYLSRTMSASGTTATFSFWVKRGTLGVEQAIFLWSNGSTDSYGIEFNANDTLLFFSYSFSFILNLTTTQVFRDPSAWYHIVCVQDTTQATAANRAKIYVNGTQVTAFSTATYPAQNTVLKIASSNAFNIGRSGGTGALPFDGYMAEWNFIDGQALTPSSFGETNATTGVWQPKSYTGTYGTNGFYLKFSNIALTSGSNTGLGQDFSGNGNYWNTNNISVTAGTTYDAMTDSPTPTSATVGNYSTMNPLNRSSSSYPVINIANLNISSLSDQGGGAATNSITSTMAVNSGKWYCEVTYNTSNSNGSFAVGITKTTNRITSNLYSGVGAGNSYLYYGYNGQKYNGSAGSAYGASLTTNDVAGIAFDLDTGSITFYKNNVSQGTAYTWTPDGSFWNVLLSGDSSATSAAGSVNFGQRPFAYTPPTGFNRLNTFNIPTSTVVQGSSYMVATLYTGNGGTQTITNASGLRPDLVWFKERSSNSSNWLFDTIRGIYNRLSSNETTAEGSQTNSLTAFNSNGFSVGSDVAGNESGQTYVAWQWIANASTVTNTSGTISSQVRVNTTSGFSIVTYTGTGANATVGHGLGVAPKMVIVKNRTGAAKDWSIYNSNLGSNKVIWLNLTNASTTDGSPGHWNNTSPTSTVFSLGTDTDVNVNTINYVAYCWSEIAGFSRFSSYTGNGSADGTFVYTGFRPKYVMLKRTDISGDGWTILDTSRSPSNVSKPKIEANSNVAENTSYNVMDILSNGFKLRDADRSWNASGGTYIYMAFAENPFKNALAR